MGSSSLRMFAHINLRTDMIQTWKMSPWNSIILILPQNTPPLANSRLQSLPFVFQFFDYNLFLIGENTVSCHKKLEVIQKVIFARHIQPQNVARNNTCCTLAPDAPCHLLILGIHFFTCEFIPPNQ